MTLTPKDAAVARLMHGAAPQGTLDLSIGEPDQKLPAVLAERAVASLGSGAGYTAKLGLESLRRAIADRLPVPVDASDVTVTVGGTEAVAVALMTACRAGDSVLVPDPAWPNYRVLAEQLGVRVLPYRQGATRDDFFDWDAIEAGLDSGATMVVVNSPSNPMAAVASPSDLQRLVGLVRAHAAFVLSDEAYESIVFDGGSAPSPLAAEGGRDVVFCARTFSKTYSMTGLRVGALVAPSAVRHRTAAFHGTMVGCAPRIAQEVAEHALTALPGRGAELSAIYRSRFALALDRVGEWMPHTSVDGNGGFYVWLDGSHTGRTADELAARIEARGFRVSSGNAYTTSESHAIRLALTATEEQLDGAFAAIRAVFDVAAP